MKHFYFSIIIITMLLVIVFGCTVDSTRGAISIANASDKDFNQVKFGNTILTLYVPKGGSASYAYFSPMSGKLSCAGIEKEITLSSQLISQQSIAGMVLLGIVPADATASDLDDPELTFRLGYGYNIVIAKSDGDYYFDISFGPLGLGLDTVDDLDDIKWPIDDWN